MDVVAIIPAYNEADNIKAVVEETKKYVDGIVVVNDQSIDETAEIAMQSGADVVTTVGVRGAGGALITGIDYVKRKYNPDAIVFLDGDGQHDPTYIVSMVGALMGCDMVITSRFMHRSVTTNMPAYRKFGIWMITMAYNIGAKFTVKDSQCGMRAFRANKLYDLNLQEHGFGYSTEILVKARKNGYRIFEIPTVVKYHDDFKKNSTINPFKHGFNVIMMTLKWRVKCELFGQC